VLSVFSELDEAPLAFEELLSSPRLEAPCDARLLLSLLERSVARSDGCEDALPSRLVSLALDPLRLLRADEFSERVARLDWESVARGELSLARSVACSRSRRDDASELLRRDSPF